MVDWSLARQLARFAAGAGAAPPKLGSVDFPALVGETEGHLREYTGLTPVDAIPAPEAVGRAEWAEANIDSLGALIGPVADRLGTRAESARPIPGAPRAAARPTPAARSCPVSADMSP